MRVFAIIFGLYLIRSCFSNASVFDGDGELDEAENVEEIVKLQSSIYQEFTLDFYSDDNEHDNVEQVQELVFAPESLTFLNCPVSIARTAEFSVENRFNFDLQLYSVTSDNSQFHPILFHPQTIPPQQAAVIQLLYLPCFQETVFAELRISTSQGDYSYSLQGQSVRNPYGLHPFMGNKVPMGHLSTFELPILMFNPFLEPLHVREVFTTEGFLSLKGAPLRNDNYLVGSNQSAPGVAGGSADGILGQTDSVSASAVSSADAMWVVPPGTEKEIITLSVSSPLAPGAYQGFVHIKTDRDNMVLLVELTVLEGGVYAIPETVQFGVLTSVSERKTVDLWLLNSGDDTVLITDIIPHTPDPQLQIMLLDNPVLQAGGSTETLVATLIYTASAPGMVSNKLLVLTNCSNLALAVVEVPYSVSVLHGGVGFEHQKSVFLTPIRNSSTSDNSFAPSSHEQIGNSSEQLTVFREFMFTNYFNAPVGLVSVTVASCADLFSVASLEGDHVVDSLGKWDPVSVGFNGGLVAEYAAMSPDFLPKTCWLEVLTNISSHRIPLHVMDGALDLQFMDAVRAFYNELRVCLTGRSLSGNAGAHSSYRGDWCRQLRQVSNPPGRHIRLAAQAPARGLLQQEPHSRALGAGGGRV